MNFAFQSQLEFKVLRQEFQKLLHIKKNDPVLIDMNYREEILHEKDQQKLSHTLTRDVLSVSHS